MFTAQGFGWGIVALLITLLNIYSVIIIIDAVISWLLLPPTSPVMRFLRFVTEPLLNPCRQILWKILPISWRRVDFSPVLAILLLQLVAKLLSML